MVKIKNISKTDLAKINQQILEDIELYQKTLQNLSFDIPIEALCLPKSLVKLLYKNHIFRVKDLFLIEHKMLKGIGKQKMEIITKSVNRVFGQNS